jgi:hypothetical protein
MILCGLLLVSEVLSMVKMPAMSLQIRPANGSKVHLL